MTAFNMISSFSIPSETLARSGVGATCLILLDLVLWRMSRPVTSGSVAMISTGMGVNMEPEVAPGTPIGTLGEKKKRTRIKQHVGINQG